MTIGRVLDNNLVTHPGLAKVEFVCDVKDKPYTSNYQYACKGAHSGGAISLIVFGIRDERDEDGLGVDYDRIEWADGRTKCDTALILDCYWDLILDDIKTIIRETWN